MLSEILSIFWQNLCAYRIYQVFYIITSPLTPLVVQQWVFVLTICFKSFKVCLGQLYPFRTPYFKMWLKKFAKVISLCSRYMSIFDQAPNWGNYRSELQWSRVPAMRNHGKAGGNRKIWNFNNLRKVREFRWGLSWNETSVV